MPVSRWAEIRLSDLPADGSVRPLALASLAGLGLAEDPARRAVYVLNHPEYDADTLAREYRRDLARGIAVARPDPVRTARKSWDATGRTLFRNWLTVLGEAGSSGGAEVGVVPISRRRRCARRSVPAG